MNAPAKINNGKFNVQYGLNWTEQIILDLFAGGGGATLSKEHLDGALRVATFLINFYGNGDCRDIRNPLDTVTTKDRLALVTVWIKGEPWVIVDICLRMLQPRELYRAQGFPDDYVIDRGAMGEPMTKTEQVFMVGNSVSPYPMEAIARSNDPWRMAWREAV